MIEVTNLILLLRIIFFWVQTWLICIFCANSSTGFSLGRHLHLKFSSCENNGVLGHGFDVLSFDCIVMHHTHFREGIPGYLFIHISICSIVSSWDSASYTSILTYFCFSFFIEILVQALLYPFKKEKNSLNFDHETGIFFSRNHI